MRDNGPADNSLLDDVEFDAAEITQAVLRPIMYWNETPPPIQPLLTTKTFPFREMWMVGIQSYLFDMVSSHYRRNQLAYNAGGLSIDDKNKEQQTENFALLKEKTRFEKSIDDLNSFVIDLDTLYEKKKLKEKELDLEIETKQIKSINLDIGIVEKEKEYKAIESQRFITVEREEVVNRKEKFIKEKYDKAGIQW
jgi:hypothetical protein